MNIHHLAEIKHNNSILDSIILYLGDINLEYISQIVDALDLISNIIN